MSCANKQLRHTAITLTALLLIYLFTIYFHTDEGSQPKFSGKNSVGKPTTKPAIVHEMQIENEQLKSKSNHDKVCYNDQKKSIHGSSPLMSKKGLAAFNKVINFVSQETRGKGIYLEWGSGGSTRVALTKDFQHVYSIENSGSYWEELSKEPNIACAISQRYLTYVFGNGGKTVAFGNPEDVKTYNSSKYIDAIDKFPG